MKSKEWMDRQNRDFYVKKAKKIGYISRSAFKILEEFPARHIIPGHGPMPPSGKKIIQDNKKMFFHGLTCRRHSHTQSPETAHQNTQSENRAGPPQRHLVIFQHQCRVKADEARKCHCRPQKSEPTQPQIPSRQTSSKDAGLTVVLAFLTHRSDSLLPQQQP